MKVTLEEVRDWLLAGAPERKFNMNTFLDTSTTEQPDNWCGTTCCIAGYVYTRVKHLQDRPPYQAVETTAAEALGLDPHTATNLFYPRAANNLGIAWKDITPAQAAQAVQNVIDHGDPMWFEVLS